MSGCCGMEEGRNLSLTWWWRSTVGHILVYWLGGGCGGGEGEREGGKEREREGGKVGMM